MRVLVVVPPGLHGFLRCGLEDEGFLVDVATSVAAAQRLLEIQRYDAMLLDPTTSAVTLAGRDSLRPRPIDYPPTLLLLGANANGAARAWRDMASGIIEVPFRFGDLLLSLDAITNRPNGG